MNEISVKTLYPDGSTSPYRAIALPAFASLCLMTGALLVLFRTWDELAVPRWALVLAAAAGYVSALAAHRLSRRHGAFYLLGLVPWIPALLMPAACVDVYKRQEVENGRALHAARSIYLERAMNNLLLGEETHRRVMLTLSDGANRFSCPIVPPC